MGFYPSSGMIIGLSLPVVLIIGSYPRQWFDFWVVSLPVVLIIGSYPHLWFDYRVVSHQWYD